MQVVCLLKKSGIWILLRPDVRRGFGRISLLNHDHEKKTKKFSRIGSRVEENQIKNSKWKIKKVETGNTKVILRCLTKRRNNDRDNNNITIGLCDDWYGLD